MLEQLRMLRAPEVQHLAGGITYPTLWGWCQAGLFPQPVVLTPGVKRPNVAWRACDVQEWLESRPVGKGARVPQPHLEARRAAKAAEEADRERRERLKAKFAERQQPTA